MQVWWGVFLWVLGIHYVVKLLVFRFWDMRRKTPYISSVPVREAVFALESLLIMTGDSHGVSPSYARIGHAYGVTRKDTIHAVQDLARSIEKEEQFVIKTLRRIAMMAFLFVLLGVYTSQGIVPSLHAGMSYLMGLALSSVLPNIGIGGRLITFKPSNTKFD